MIARPDPMIRLTKLIRAPREKVFDAWLDPDAFRRWWAPGPTEDLTELVIEPKVGGALRIVMGNNDQQHIGVGTYTVIDRPDTLAFRWTWETMPDFGADSLVTLRFLDAPNPYDDGQPATELILTHENLPTAAERSEHTGGWWNTLRALGYWARGTDPREAMYGRASAT
jgi:glutathione S-transferase